MIDGQKKVGCHSYSDLLCSDYHFPEPGVMIRVVLVNSIRIQYFWQYVDPVLDQNSDLQIVAILPILEFE